MRISHKRLTIWEDNIRRVIADIRPQMLEKSSKIGRPDWTTSNQPWQSYAKPDRQIRTSVHAPQRPMVTSIMMGTVVPGPHGLLCH
ncbi:hypothetical protein TNCV_4730681 [Trichonephila clavipes]|nr:hypothetical protein TNCV_4730681 [Trichonephila clavipes]